MKTICLKHWLLIVFCFMIASKSWSWEPPTFKPNVVDDSHLLSPTDIALINEEIQLLQSRNNLFAAIYILNSLPNESIEDVALKTFSHWKLGSRKSDNGLLMVFSITDRKARIETGYGTEGYIPDVVAKRLLDLIILPHFKEGQYATGITKGLRYLQKDKNTILLELGPQPTGSFLAEKIPYLIFVAFAVFIGLFIVLKFNAFKKQKEKVSTKPQSNTPHKKSGLYILMAFLLAGFLIPIAIGLYKISKHIQFTATGIFAFIGWTFLVITIPLILRKWAFQPGLTKHPVYSYPPEKLKLFFWGIDTPLNTIGKILAIISGGSILAKVINLEMSLASSLSLAMGLVLVFALYVFLIWKYELAALNSPRGYRRWMARRRLSRIKSRTYGTREIFGRPYTYDRPERSTKSSSSSSSDYNSSSGGGRSGGGGASSSW